MKYYLAAVLTIIAACQCYSVWYVASGKAQHVLGEKVFEAVENVLEVRDIQTKTALIEQQTEDIKRRQ